MVDETSHWRLRSTAVVVVGWDEVGIQTPRRPVKYLEGPSAVPFLRAEAVSWLYSVFVSQSSSALLWSMDYGAHRGTRSDTNVLLGVDADGTMAPTHKHYKGCSGEVEPLSAWQEVVEWRKPEGGCGEVAKVRKLRTRTPSSQPRTLVCHDMKGGYLDDRFVSGCSNKDAYRFYHWSGVDIFVYFSHHLVTIPPPGWINAAHLHGVTVFGTFITEWEEGSSVCKELLASEDTVAMAVTQLSHIASYHGFDGWLVNIENKVPQEKIPLMVKFVKDLTKAMRKQDCGRKTEEEEEDTKEEPSSEEAKREEGEELREPSTKKAKREEGKELREHSSKEAKREEGKELREHSSKEAKREEGKELREHSSKEAKREEGKDLREHSSKEAKREVKESNDCRHRVIWYDSVTKEGELAWQNELNPLNEAFFNACDGIFLNYTWSEAHLDRTRQAAGDRTRDVFVGLDVFGRNFYAGGKYDTWKAMEMARKFGLSAAIFAPGWTYETQTDFMEAEKQVWGSLSPFLTHRGFQDLPFTTSFCQGFGEHLYCRGKVEREGPWHNLSHQELQPLWSQEGEETGDGCLSLVTREAYNGGGCLGITTHSPTTLRLLLCDLEWRGKLRVSVTYKWCSPPTSLALLCHLSGKESSCKNKILELTCEKDEEGRKRKGQDGCVDEEDEEIVECIPEDSHTENGWSVRSFTAEENPGYRMSEVSVWVGGGAELRLGHLAISNT